jgi:hypothetical protein
MTTQTPRPPESEVIVPDAVFGADRTRRASPRSAGERAAGRQLRWIDRVMLVLAVITTVVVASIVVAGAAVVLAFLVAVATIIGVGRAIAARMQR